MKDDRKIDVIGLYGGTRKTHGYGESRNRVLSGNGITQSLSATDYKEPIRIAIKAKINSSQDGIVVGEEGLSPTHTAGHNNCPKVMLYTQQSKEESEKAAIPVLTPDRIHKRQNGRRFKEEGDDMFTLTSIDRHGVALKIRVANKQGYDIARDREDSINFSYPTSNTRRGRVEVGVAQTLDTKCEQGVAVIAGLGEKKSNGGTQFYQQDRVYDGEGTATSLNSQLPGGGQMYGIKPQENVDTIYYPKGDCQIAIRKLTPKECFRLQAVPDELFERAKFVNSDAQLYKQAGNAVTATVVYALAKKLTKGQK